MEKEAVDLLNLALMSMLMGAGGYGGMRLLKDLPDQAVPPEKPKNELNITLPSTRMPKLAETSAFNDYVVPTLTGLGGAGLGFFGASGIYERLKKKQIENQMSQVQQDYLNTLQQAHSKVAETNTPLIDNFIKGLISKVGEELQKSAYWGEGYVPTDFIQNQGTYGPIGQKAFEALTDNNIGHLTKATMALLAIGSTGAAYGIAKKMDQNRAESKEQSTLPTDVKLHVT